MNKVEESSPTTICATFRSASLRAKIGVQSNSLGKSTLLRTMAGVDRTKPELRDFVWSSYYQLFCVRKLFQSNPN
jgi:hypothetical protein